MARIFLLAAEATWEQECPARHVVGWLPPVNGGAAGGLTSDRVAGEGQLGVVGLDVRQGAREPAREPVMYVIDPLGFEVS